MKNVLERIKHRYWGRTGWRRILRLAKFVEKQPPERFDFERWVGTNWKGAPDLSCGTTACALGWATAMPEFQKLGLRLRRDNDEGFSINTWVGYKDCGTHDIMDTLSDEVFEISRHTFGILFFPRPYGVYESDRLSVNATPKEWATHARRIVQDLRKGSIT